jgi:hypothetical protein
MLEARIVAARIHGLEVSWHGIGELGKPRMTPSSQGCLRIPFIGLMILRREFEVNPQGDLPALIRGGRKEAGLVYIVWK